MLSRATLPSYQLVVRINGVDAAFSRYGRRRTQSSKVCTSVSLYVFRGAECVFHVMVDVGPGVVESLQDPTLFPPLFPLDCLVLSHAHADHWLGFDGLVGDRKRHHPEQGLPRLKVVCFPETFDKTIGGQFSYLKDHVDHETAEDGSGHRLWSDDRAFLAVTFVEVQHWLRSAVTVFELSAETSETARVVCLFDIDDFHSPASSQAQAGSRPENPLFRHADLLIAEANTWAAEGTGHITFQRLALFLRRWTPVMTRIVHYSGYEDLDGGGEYARKLAQRLRIHPAEGPVSDWEMNAAIQALLGESGFPNPFTVSVAYQGETLPIPSQFKHAAPMGPRVLAD